MRLIRKEFPLDKKTFRNITPDSNYRYWIGGLKRYQAMDDKWITRDPPGSPTTFFVTPSNKIFLEITKALTAIKYIPKDNKDALRTAIIIANEDSPDRAHVILNDSEKIEGIPKSVLDGLSIAPAVVKNKQAYNITIYSYVSRENENHFVHAYHTVWRHLITIDGYTYADIVKIIWEKR